MYEKYILCEQKCIDKLHKSLCLQQHIKNNKLNKLIELTFRLFRDNSVLALCAQILCMFMKLDLRANFRKNHLSLHANRKAL